MKAKQANEITGLVNGGCKSPQSQDLSNLRRRQLTRDASSPNVGDFGDALDVEDRRHLRQATELFPDGPGGHRAQV